ncbi:MAG TPA: sigma-70 family RNA polymerase sigma factor [Candidatus Bathyarchaeia archaeon]|nr:sigma-70 family RNA polymerase sigma factor [Candidatus Bathyarchaeia archaeon]
MELLERFAAGDLDAFASLFRQYQRDVYRWTVRIVRDPAAAEDLTVETFWRAHRAHGQFHADGNFAGWLRRIATNLALDHLRRARPLLELPDQIAAAEKPDLVVQQETRQIISRAFAQLPPRLRVVLQLGLIEDESYNEIAVALGISLPAVKLRMFRGVRMLRKKLEQQGVRP